MTMYPSCTYFWGSFEYGGDITPCAQLVLILGTHFLLLVAIVVSHLSTREALEASGLGLQGWQKKFWAVWFSLFVLLVGWSFFDFAHRLVSGNEGSGQHFFDFLTNLERAFKIVTVFFSIRLQRIGGLFSPAVLWGVKIAAPAHAIVLLWEVTSLFRKASYSFQHDGSFGWDVQDDLEFLSALVGLSMSFVIMSASISGRKRLIKSISFTSLVNEDMDDMEFAKEPLLKDLIDEAKEFRVSEHGSEGPAPAKSLFDEAVFTSKLLFQWVNPLLKIGYTRQLELEDLPDLPSRISTKEWAEKFLVLLGEERARGKDASLFHVMHRCFGKGYYWLGVGKLLTDGLGFAGPLLLKGIVSYVESYQDRESSTRKKDGVTLVILLCASSLAAAFIGTQYTFAIYQIQLRMRASIIAAVFHRSLELRLKDQTQTNLSTGEITNLMSVDSQRLMDVASSFNELWSLPVQVGITLYLLYREVSFAFVAGVIIICGMIPLNTWIANKISRVTSKLMDHKDSRVRLCHETLRGIRELKLLSLQEWLASKVRLVRREEVSQLAARKYLDAWCVFFWAFMPTLVALATFGCLMMPPGSTAPSASSVFTAVALLNMLIYPMNAFPWVINGIMEAYVSLGRMQRFLLTSTFEKDPQIQGRDKYDTNIYNQQGMDNESQSLVELDSTTFSWSANNTSFFLQDISLRLSRGQVIAVCGEVGSGKSMFMKALLGELHLLQGQVFRRKMKVAFCGQRPWIQSGTLESNITAFGNSSDDLEEVLQACGLLEDLKQFSAGLQTEIGERGVTLSGGQRQRVSLARAAFSKPDLLLMDDPLSALDPRTAEHVLQSLIMEFAKMQLGSGCLFTTHAVHLIEDCDTVVVLKSGRVVECGKPKELKAKQDSVFSLLSKKAAQFDQKSSTVSSNPVSNSFTGPADKDLPPDNGKLFEKEQRMKGAVQLGVYTAYAESVGWIVTAATLLSLVLMQLSANSFSYWLSYWTSHEGVTKQSFFIISGGIAGGAAVATLLRSFLFAFGGLKAAKTLHDKLFGTVLACPMSFFDKTPLGRLMNRFSSDVFTIDDQLPFMLNILLAQTVGLLGTAIILAVSNAWSIVILVPVLSFYGVVQAYYRWSSRELRRLDSVSRSPIFALFSETLDGAPVIRAFNAEQKFIQQNISNLHANQRALLAGNAASQWLSLRLQLLGVLVVTFFASVAIIQCHKGTSSPSQEGLVGLGLSYALSIVSNLNGLLSAFTETEKEMVSVERVKEYDNLDPEENESQNVQSTIPDAWPDNGNVIVEKLTVRYKESAPPALNNISFNISAGDKIGIVGRTGSGKSSLMMAFFRMIDYTGTIRIDGLNLKSLGLNMLRHRLSAITQEPLLFSGSLRENLDPQGLYDDSQLWLALERCHMKEALCQGTTEDGLDSGIGHKGLSFSVGQRQLLCLARAVLKKSGLVFIDEATANVDASTDSLVQETLKENFSDCTVLMIAHRLSSVFNFCNRVISLSNGSIVYDGSTDDFKIRDINDI